MPSIINATTSTGLVSSADNSGELQLATNNGTTAVTITTAQNVLVNSTTLFDPEGYAPGGSKFIQVRSTATDRASFLNLIGGGGGSPNYWIGGINYAISGQANSAARIYSYTDSSSTSGTLIFGTASNTSSAGPLERMRITSTGQVNLFRATGDDTQIDFLRMQGGGASAGDNLAFLSKYTASVSTSAKPIFGGPPRGCLVIVTGYTGASYFSDILNCSSNSVTVISSQNSTGSPASRTYSIVSFVLNLAMGSGTYNVGTLLLGTTARE